MRSVTSSRPGRGMLPQLADMSPADRPTSVWEFVHPRLREIAPYVELEWVSVWPWTPRRGGLGGYMVEIVCHLPTRHSDADADDLATIAGLVESQIGVGLLSLAGSLWVTNIDVQPEAPGVLLCVAHVRVPSARLRRRAPRSRMGLARRAR